MLISKKWLIGLGGLLVAAGLAIGLGVGLDRRGKQSGQASSSSDPKSTPIPSSAPSHSRDDSPAGPLPVSLSLTSFDPKMLAGYDECSDFVLELGEMAKYMANVHIDRMALQHYHNEYFYNTPRGGSGGFNDIVMLDNEMVSPQIISDKSDNSNSNTGESSYGTNNQVEGVDEADTVKSDGVHVYAAYGDNLVVWEASSGTEVSRTVIPTTDDEGIPLCDSQTTDYCYENKEWQKMNIASLLMHQDRITAIVQSPYRIRDQDSDQDQSTMHGSHATRLFVYDKSIPSNKGPLTLIAQKDIQGYYQSARLIDQYAHVVTSTSINAWYHLYDHLDPMNFVDKSERHLDFYYNPKPDLKGMNETEYRIAANAKATELIPSFAEQLASESLGTTDISSEDCTSILRLILYSKRNDKEGEEELSPISFTTAGALSNFAQVTSFNINAATGNMDGGHGKLSTSSSGVFVPFNSYSNSVYSSRDMMIIAGEAYEENSDGNWEEKTVLFAFSLNGDESKAVSIGLVPGSLLNQFSMDHYSYGDADYLRVATTSWARWSIVGDSWGQTEESSSQVTVLSLPSPGSQTDTPTNMEIIGQVDNLGKGERIYAVRFLGTRAFVVTFRQIDPFYTLNMEDPANPKVVGELKIPGFSNYLHPIGDGNLILAVGQDANEDGQVSGLQVAIYDVSDFGDPSQLKKFSENKGSYSAAQYDHQAFRYLPKTEVLILPVSRWDPRFDGFIVYDVPVAPEKKIAVRFEISHVEEEMNTCWSHSSLTARSMVFNGTVTTMKGHTVLSHALSTNEKEWIVNLDVNRGDVNKEKDCGYWWK